MHDFKSADERKQRLRKMFAENFPEFDNHERELESLVRYDNVKEFADHLDVLSFRYNWFISEEVAQLVDKYEEYIDFVRFGREGSPSLYLYCDDMPDAVKEHMKEDFKDKWADNIRDVRHEKKGINFWWD